MIHLVCLSDFDTSRTMKSVRRRNNRFVRKTWPIRPISHNWDHEKSCKLNKSLIYYTVIQNPVFLGIFSSFVHKYAFSLTHHFLWKKFSSISFNLIVVYQLNHCNTLFHSSFVIIRMGIYEECNNFNSWLIIHCSMVYRKRKIDRFDSRYVPILIWKCSICSFRNLCNCLNDNVSIV